MTEDSEILKAIGSRIKELRAVNGLSQIEVGYISGFSREYIGQIERGQRSINIKTLNKIINALNATWEEFFRDFDGRD